jgi:hypothetical protein
VQKPLRNTEQEDVVSLLQDMLPNGKGLLVMMSVYLDRGERHAYDDGIMSVAAVVFKQVPYKQFLRPWNRMLRGWGASAFHATDFYPGGGEFERKTPERQKRFENDSRNIPRFIGEHIQRALVISFRPEEFNRMAPPQWKEQFGTSLYSLSVQFCTLSLGWWVKDNHIPHDFAYFVESGDGGDIEKTVERMRGDPTTKAHIRVRSFATVDKGAARGLEASDFFAWHWNKYYLEKLRIGQGRHPRKDFAAFVGIANGKVREAFIIGDKLKEFLAIKPPVQRIEERNK